MEEAHQIVLQALHQAGVGIPPGVESLQDLSPAALVGMCRGALACIEGASCAAPPPFPISMAERFRVCSELASFIKHLGFKEDLSFHQFLYPSEEESYKVLIFLLGKLSKSSSDANGSREGCNGSFANDSVNNLETFVIAREAPSVGLEDGKQNTSTGTAGGERTGDPTNAPFRTHPLQLASINGAQGKKTPPLITLKEKPKPFLIPSVFQFNAKNASTPTALPCGRLSYLALEAQNMETTEMGDLRVKGKGLLQDPNISSYLDVESSYLSQELMFGKEKELVFLRERIRQGEGEGKAQHEESAGSYSDGQADLEQGELRTLEERLQVILVDNTKLSQEIAEFKEGSSKLEVDCEALSRQLKVLNEKRDLTKIALEMALDSSQMESSKLLQSKKAIGDIVERLADFETHWESVYAELESKKGQLELSASNENEELQAKLQELQNVRQQIRDTTIKLKQREEQLKELSASAEAEKGTKGPLRSTYVRRITDLIKNSKKQDMDISRIIGETRDLHRESNANQGRLKRTYALVDELVFRDAKKDPASRQAYRLLTSIHQDFSDCYDKVFAMDKIHREIADLQATVETMEKKPVDLKRIQADIDALVAENLVLEKSLQAAQADGSMQTK